MRRIRVRRRGLAAALAGILAGTLMASCGGGAVQSRQTMPTGRDIAYVINEAGIVPFNMKSHATGHLMTQPFWSPNDQLVVAADGRTAFVTSGPGLVPLNLATGKFGAPIVKSFPWDAMAVTPNGKTIWVTNSLAKGEEGKFNAIAPLNTRTGHLGKPIPVPGLPVGINIAPDGLTAYVQTEGGADLTVVNLSTGAVGPVFQIPDGDGDIAIESGGDIGWATGAGNDLMENCPNSCLTPINLVNGVTGPPIPLVHDPYGIVLTPDGHTAYVTGGEAGPPAPPDVTEIDLSSGKVTGTFSIPGGASSIVNATS